MPLPASCAARMTPSAVPYPPVARAPALQCVRTVAPSGTSSAPSAPIARHAATSSRWIASASACMAAALSVAPSVATSAARRLMRAVCPREVHRGRARGVEDAAGDAIGDQKRLRVPRLGPRDLDQGVGGTDPDRGRSAHDHVADAVGHLIGLRETVIGDLTRQRALLEHDHLAGLGLELDGEEGLRLPGDRGA